MKTGLLLFILITLALIETSGGELRIRPYGPNFIKMSGSSMVVTCEYISNGEDDDGGPPIWLDNRGEIIGERNRRFVENDLGIMKLYITSISEDDAGEYKCVKGTESRSIYLQIFKDITFDDAPTVQHLNVSSNGTIRCVVSGTPEVRISWRKNSRRIGTADQLRLTVTREGLKILNVTKDDEGWYTCRAEVDLTGSYSEQRIQVFVDHPPLILGNLGQIDALLGSHSVVSCTVQGFPYPLVNFSKLSLDDDDGEEEDISSVDDVTMANNTLTFVNISKSHEGRYRCTATNILGRHSQTFSLRVLVPPEVILPPFVATDVGSEVTISCLGLGDPMPHLTMSRKMDGRNLSGEEFSSGRMQTSRSPGVLNLTIAMVTVEDSDIFTCTAVSSVGRSSEDLRLVVQYSPRFEEGNMTSLVYGWGDQVVQINCIVHGEPKVNIQWYKGQDMVTGSESYQEFETSSGSVLQVSLRGESGEGLHGMYTCRATNKLGSDDFNITLEIPPVPDKPDVRVLRLRPDDVSIYISSRLQGEASFQVTHYSMSLVAEHGSTSNVSVPVQDMDQISNFSAATAIIESLIPNTSYILFVSSVNPVGPGDASRVEFRTYEPRIPDEIAANVTSSDSNSVTLNWKPPYSGGSNITGYLVCHRKVKSSDVESLELSSTWIENSLPPHFPPSFMVVPTGKVPQQDETSYHHVPPHDQLTFEVGDLEPSSFYQVKVVAVNDIGSSPAQPEFFVQTNRGSKGFLPFFLQTSNSSILIGLVFIVIVALVVVVDISCYVLNDCGLLMCCCMLACGKAKKHSISPRKSKADKREFNDLISSMKHPPLEGVENLPDEVLDVVVIDNSTTSEPIRMPTENHLNEIGGGKEEDRCPLVEEKLCSAEEDAIDRDDDDDDEELPTPPVIASGPLHIEKSELITPKNRRSIMNFGDARWKDVVHELESQLGVKKPDLEEEEEEEEEEDEYTGPSSPKWRHT